MKQSDIGHSVSKANRRDVQPTSCAALRRIWERMVRSCKETMLAVVGNRTLTDDVLSTNMCLVEQMLNSKPLTSVNDDPEDLEALTPNHFLLGRAVPATSFIPDALH